MFCCPYCKKETNKRSLYRYYKVYVDGVEAVKVKKQKNALKQYRVSTSKIEEEVWRAFSLLVKAESGYECEIHAKAREMGIVLPFKCDDERQTCHIVPRTDRALKYNRLNVYCGCAGGNLWEVHHRLEFDRLWRTIWPERVAELERLRGSRAKRNRMQLQQMGAHFKRELAKHTTKKSA